jgi:hypothetical protein
VVLIAVSAAAIGTARGETDAGRPAVARERRLAVAGELRLLAMDGGRVAYDLAGDALAKSRERRCNRVRVWTVAAGRTVAVSGRRTCTADSTSTGAGVRELALAGARVAWIRNVGGNTESDDELYTASLGRPRERRLASASRHGDVDCVLTGRWLGGLVGDRDLLVYNAWTTTAANPGQQGSCAMKATSGALRRIAGARTSRIAAGTDVLVATDADRGRIAVLREGGRVALYSPRGGLVRAFAATGAKEVAIAGDFLALLTRTRALEIYGVPTGALVRTLGVASDAAHLDAASGVAAYAAGRRLHVVQLRTGKDVVLAAGLRSIVEVAIDDPGVAYGYNLRWSRRLGSRAKIVFVPMARVLRALAANLARDGAARGRAAPRPLPPQALRPARSLSHRSLFSSWISSRIASTS